MASRDQRERRRFTPSLDPPVGARAMPGGRDSGADSGSRGPREKRKFTSLPPPPVGDRDTSGARGPRAAPVSHARDERRRFVPSLDPPAAFRGVSSVGASAAAPVLDARAPIRSEGDGGSRSRVSDVDPPPAKKPRGPTRPTLSELVDDLADRCVADLQATKRGELKSVIANGDLESMDNAADISRSVNILTFSVRFVVAVFNCVLCIVPFRSFSSRVRTMRSCSVPRVASSRISGMLRERFRWSGILFARRWTG